MHILLSVVVGCVPENDLQPREEVVEPELSVETVTDVIFQPDQALVDVLWIVDNSCSMENNQDALAQHFPQFMDWFLDENLDYHIGVVTTDAYEGGEGGVLRPFEGGRWLTPETDDPLTAFRQMATVGSTGTQREAGLGSAYLALGVRILDTNKGFLRPEASLHTIVISDEDDGTPEKLTDADDFVAFYGQLKEQPDRRTFSAIVETGGEFRADTYVHVSETLGGARADIRDKSWVSVLDDLGRNMTLPKTDFFLSRTPYRDDVAVLVLEDGTEVPFFEGVDWSYDPVSNAVQFLGAAPAPGAEVRITYSIEVWRQG
ncbi:MAG: hypothetical protein KTR31_13670 [Myxococcales bacterium]|nr:hypothetical protein [Myxococcales bacterium]